MLMHAAIVNTCTRSALLPLSHTHICTRHVCIRKVDIIRRHTYTYTCTVCLTAYYTYIFSTCITCIGGIHIIFNIYINTITTTHSHTHTHSSYYQHVYYSYGVPPMSILHSSMRTSTIAYCCTSAVYRIAVPHLPAACYPQQRDLAQHVLQHLSLGLSRPSRGLLQPMHCHSPFYTPRPKFRARTHARWPCTRCVLASQPCNQLLPRPS